MSHSSHAYLVSTAQAADIDTITALLQANSPSQGGSLTGEFSRDKVASMADGASPVIVARRTADGPVVGVLFIRRDNIGSLRAHERLGMREVAAFVFDGAQFAVYSDAIVAS
ncbi:hypothetical protein [Janthinobacterium sp. GMG1]|uniref:hypothetical protein n=1 Tax=Janthinobacterium sp. GMG1 TaxID=3096007 RepID=UPI002ACAF664|nr:hypothetical protein [Janthinobacterium sp. GMG1]MDZ5633424.1 hypothetical protein [Janthinobacterium sp. GMG1]